MVLGFSNLRLWRLLTLLGGLLIATGVLAFYVDVAAHFRFDFIENHYDGFGTSIVVGTVLVFIGCIGWARFSGKKRRAIMAGLVFIAPFAALLLGSPIDGGNVHGPSAITMMLIFPSTILAVVLLIMAAFGSREAK